MLKTTIIARSLGIVRCESVRFLRTATGLQSAVMDVLETYVHFPVSGFSLGSREKGPEVQEKVIMEAVMCMCV